MLTQPIATVPPCTALRREGRRPARRPLTVELLRQEGSLALLHQAVDLPRGVPARHGGEDGAHAHRVVDTPAPAMCRCLVVATGARNASTHSSSTRTNAHDGLDGLLDRLLLPVELRQELRGDAARGKVGGRRCTMVRRVVQQQAETGGVRRVSTAVVAPRTEVKRGEAADEGAPLVTHTSLSSPPLPPASAAAALPLDAMGPRACC